MFRKMSSFRALLGASVCLLPLLPVAALADDFDVSDKPAEAAAPPSPNWITVGGQYSSGRSDYINRFSGNQAPGWNAVGSFNFISRDAWDSGKTFYFNVSGDRLGETDRSVAIRVGEQGTWGLNVTYDGISYDGGHNYQSIFNSTGGLVGGLQPGSLTYDFALVQAATAHTNALWKPVLTAPVPLQAYDMSLQRDIFGINGKYQFGDWQITSGWRHEHKQGFQANSLTIAGVPSLTSASSGGSYAAPTSTKPGSSSTLPNGTFSSGMAYFLQPVEYETDRFDAMAAYSTRTYQAQLSYTYSQFQDSLQSVSLLNPWAFTPSSSIGTTSGAVAAITGIYTLPPSNSAHQVKGSFGYNFTPTTRLTANLGYGLQAQNATFVPGTGSTTTAGATLPTTGLNGVVETLFGNVALTMQPLPKLNIRAAYTIDTRDNQTTKNAWINYPMSSSSSSQYIYQNTPFSFRHQTASLEAGYRIFGQTKLTVSDTLDEMYRSYASATDVESNRVQVKLRGPVTESVYGSLSGAYEQRWAHAYDPNAWWAVHNALPGANNITDPSNFMMFYEASRRHGEVKAMVDATPFDGMSVSLFGKAARDTYPAASNTLGLRNNRNLSVGPDVAWEVSKNLQLHAFYTYQQLYFDEAALYSSGYTASTNTVSATGYYTPYKLQDTNSVQTVGVSADWQAIPQKLKLGFDANLSMGDTAYALGEGVALLGSGIFSPTAIPANTFQSLPDVKSTLMTVSLKGEYSLTPTSALLFGYTFERFNYKDFMNGVGATQYANAFVPGTMNPNESVHIVYAALRVHF
jgi:MtrB/PioB family decaheme-associated outer membrane protein